MLPNASLTSAITVILATSLANLAMMTFNVARGATNPFHERISTPA